MKVGELIRLLEEDGWRLARTRGSQNKNANKPGTVNFLGPAAETCPRLHHGVASRALLTPDCC